MKKTILFTLLLIKIATLNAQEKKRTGEVVLKDGTKRAGFIYYKNWNVNPEEIKFQETINSKPEILGKSDISSFTVKDEEINENYKLFTVNIDTSKQALGELDSNRLAENKRKTIFLQTLLTGNISLYLVKLNSNREQYFFQKKDEEPVELFNKRYLKGFVLLQSPGFRNQLFIALNDCKDITTRQINSLAYEEKPLIKIISSYNKCKGGNSKPVFEKKDYKLPPQLIAYAGVTFNKLDVKNPKEISPVYSFEPTTGVLAGAMIEFPVRRTNKRFSIITDAGFRTYSFNTDATDRHNSQWIEKYNVNLNLEYLNLGVGVKTYLSSKKIKPFIQFQYVNAWLVNDKNERIKEKTFAGTVTTERLKYFESLRKNEQFLELRLGVGGKKVGVNAAFSLTNGFSPYETTKTTISSAGLQLQYKLSKN
ncbi:hypothetical protein [Rubrolithibacter danxiaensis]|uniref:hypothetical protein n=1 Tax=Rubrolithibacter danxiaensis TaxID=3390805 RepID=UPI003BF8DE5C